ncbi:hypothetical protein [Nonomuraea sp. NPDC050786]|uniref:hypothetical protein n=1 Tax=Nonomuraea sp. NPDC050786 TaxID=3154840 RepID=UPI0033F3F179
MAVAQPRGRTAATSDGKRQYTLDLPMLSIQVRQPDVRLPHIEMPHMEMPRINRQELGHYMDVARTFLPAPERMAYYGALGALAAFGVLEWPVAAAIGAGTVIAQRRPRQAPMFGGQAGRQPSRPQETAAAAKEPEPTPSSGRAATTRRKTATATAGAGGRKTTAGKTTAGKTAAGKTTAGKTTSTSTSRRKSTSPSK